MIVLLAWLLGLFAFVGFGGSSASGTAVATSDCTRSAPAYRLPPNVHLAAPSGSYRPRPAAKPPRRTAPPNGSLPDSGRAC